MNLDERSKRSEGDLLVRRFWEKTERRGDCILWTGSKTADGYGKIRINGKDERAHRVAFMLAGKEIPSGLVLDHFACDTPSCVNPEHLRACTVRENNLRGKSFASENAAKEVCPRGHPYDRVLMGGRARGCSLCLSEQKKAWREKNPHKRIEERERRKARGEAKR